MLNTRSLLENLKKYALGFAATMCSLALLAGLVGCSSQPTTPDSEDQTITASEYMVKLNEASSSLHEGLDDFSQAVADGDLSTLQSKADTAFKAMDSLSDLQVPEEINDVKDQYNEAISSLRSSLDDYISLYTEIMSEPDLEKVNEEKYADRFEEIQKQYDNAMNLLEKADAAAKDL